MGSLQVVGMGSCCVDYLASVAAFPRPDEKLRSETLEVRARVCVCACENLCVDVEEGDGGMP